LIQRQQIVIPIAISVCSQIGCVPSRTDNAYVGAFAVARIDDKEGVAFNVNTRDHLLASPFPVSRRVSHVRNVFMWALGMRFSDASNLNVGHFLCLLSGA
jgi:hypothetical protein